MTKARLDGLYLLLLGSVLFVSMGSVVALTGSDKMEDFKLVYYHARCLLQHGDPYKPSKTLRAYLVEGGKPTQCSGRPLQDMTPDLYPPTTSVFIAPFAMLQWVPAHVLWMIFTAGSFILAAYLMWDLGADHAPVLSGCLVSFLLANSTSLLITGNPAGIAISLCVVAVWCFLRDRFVWAGIPCLAASLALKPHDAGLVWLYFLLAGAPYRKRALQTLFFTAVLGLAAIMWVTPIAPHWIQELHFNLLVFSAPGGPNDPGPASGCVHTAGMVINLQSVISIFRDDPSIYNSASYLGNL
ncbi:MAG TPA: glycosyltransferase family 87 protein [Terracidiphilus sp.]|nr:glycosyltransferase family 87 protein [Terracidiphilus sp.]